MNKPPFTDTYLSGGSIPVLNSTRPLLVLEDNFVYPLRAIAARGLDQYGSILHNCRVIVESADIVDTPCHGAFCDQQSLMKGDNMCSRCACIQMNKSGKIAVVWGLRVQLPNGPDFRTSFTSKSFTNEFIFKGTLPVNTKACHFLDNYVIEDRLLEAGINIFDYINTNGLFKVILWVKRGEVLDQGVDQPNNGLPYHAESTRVESGNLNHHIVRLFPMKPDDLDMTEFEALKFNIDESMRI